MQLITPFAVAFLASSAASMPFVTNNGLDLTGLHGLRIPNLQPHLQCGVLVDCPWADIYRAGHRPKQQPTEPEAQKHPCPHLQCNIIDCSKCLKPGEIGADGLPYQPLLNKFPMLDKTTAPGDKQGTPSKTTPSDSTTGQEGTNGANQGTQTQNNQKTQKQGTQDQGTQDQGTQNQGTQEQTTGNQDTQTQ